MSVDPFGEVFGIRQVRERRWFERKPGNKVMLTPLETVDYYMVRVGTLWIKEPYYDFIDREKLTKDFREAKQFRGTRRPPLFQFKDTLDHAHALAKEYGGKVVRVRLSIDEVTEEDQE